MPLFREDGFLPRFDKFPEELSKRAKLLFLCYPNNPTGAVAPLSFWQDAVAWAKGMQDRGKLAEFSVGPASLEDVYVRQVVTGDGRAARVG